MKLKAHGTIVVVVPEQERFFGRQVISFHQCPARSLGAVAMSFSITKTQGYGKRRLRDVRIAATVPVYLFSV